MKILADIHEELEDAMRVAGRMYLKQYAADTLSSLKDFAEYAEGERETNEDLILQTIEDAKEEAGIVEFRQVPETILRIEEFHGRKPYEKSWCEQDGFAIVTTRQTIHLGISNGQSCCEHWGYFLTEDDTSKFLGSQLLGVTVTDTNRASKELNQEHGIPPYEGDTMFVDIETTNGVLQFVAYNAHNGYYGHTATVISDQHKEDVTL